MKSIVPFLAERIKLSVESAGWEKLYRKVYFLHTVAEIMLSVHHVFSSSRVHSKATFITLMRGLL